MWEISRAEVRATVLDHKYISTAGSTETVALISASFLGCTPDSL
jgi:hypothetical protein